VTEKYTQLTTNYRYCMTLFLNRSMGAVTTGSGSEFQILILTLIWATPPLRPAPPHWWRHSSDAEPCSVF